MTSRQGAGDTPIAVDMVDSVLVVDDVTKDSRFSENSFLLEKGIRFYAGAPLRTTSGFVVGSLCMIDTEPRTFSEEDEKTLQAMADDLMVKVEAECESRRGEEVTDAAQ